MVWELPLGAHLLDSKILPSAIVVHAEAAVGHGRRDEGRSGASHVEARCRGLDWTEARVGLGTGEGQRLNVKAAVERAQAPERGGQRRG